MLVITEEKETDTHVEKVMDTHVEKEMDTHVENEGSAILEMCCFWLISMYLDPCEFSSVESSPQTPFP